MKNMVKCIICSLLLVALMILTSCGRRDDASARQSSAVDTTMVLKDPVTGIQVRPSSSVKVSFHEDTSAHLRFSSNDSISSKEELSRRSQKDMIRWATLGGM